MRQRVAAVIPCAGIGSRLGLRSGKSFATLGGRALASYAIAAMNRSPSIDAIVIAAEETRIDRFRSLVKRFRFQKVIAVVKGGKSRFESVRNCMGIIGRDFDLVLIHDGARPLVDEKTISQCVAAARKFGAAVACVPETDTVKRAKRGGFIGETLNRKIIFRAQTPQAFRRKLAARIYKMPGCGATDDSSLAERLGRRVKIVSGSYRNIKITTKEDLKIAEALLCG